jgi:hypothetical protein
MTSEIFAILSHVMRVNRIMRWQIRFHQTLGNTCAIDLDFCVDCGDFIAGVAHRDWFSN